MRVLEEIGVLREAITVVICEEPKRELGFGRKTALGKIYKPQSKTSV